MTCGEFEVAIEQRRHGALEEPGRTALERHLSGCASCRAFDETVRRTEATMSAMSDAELSAADWDKVGAGVRRGLARLVYGLVALVLVAAASAALAAWAAPARAPERAVAALLGIAPVALAYGIVAALTSLRLARLDRGGEMLRLHARMVRGRVRALAVVRFVAAAVAALLAWQALEPGHAARVRLVLGVDAAVEARPDGALGDAEDVGDRAVAEPTRRGNGSRPSSAGREPPGRSAASPRIGSFDAAPRALLDPRPCRSA